MTGKKQRNDRLIALLITGVLLINYPLLTLLDRPNYLFGLPVLYLFLFVFWLVFICLLAAAMYTSEDEQTPETPPSDPTD